MKKTSGRSGALNIKRRKSLAGRHHFYVVDVDMRGQCCYPVGGVGDILGIKASELEAEFAEMAPEGISLVAVLGFFASKLRSM